MKVLIRKASDDYFEEKREVSELLEEFFKKLGKEFECSRFIVKMNPLSKNECKVKITIYDDYME